MNMPQEPFCRFHDDSRFLHRPTARTGAPKRTQGARRAQEAMGIPFLVPLGPPIQAVVWCLSLLLPRESKDTFERAEIMVCRGSPGGNREARDSPGTPG